MQPAIDRLDGVATVLLCGSGDQTDAVCRRLLDDAATAGRTLLWVSFGREPADCLDGCTVEGTERAVLAVGASPTDGRDDDVTVAAVSTPSDLAALGIKLSQFLSETDGDLTVCFDSVTAMLRHVDLDTAYEFLHTVTRQCYLADARIHFHLDPATHDTETVAAITSLCDARVDHDETVSVRVRDESE